MIIEGRCIIGIPALVQVLVKEVRGGRGSVVRADKGLDLLREAVLVGYGQAVIHVADDVLGALHRRFALVVFLGIGAQALVLNEAERVLHFSNVVVEGGGAQQGHIGICGVAHGVYQVHHLQAVLEGAGRLGAELLQQRVVGIGHLFQTGLRHQVEHALEQVDERIQGHGGHGAHKNLGGSNPPQRQVAGVNEPEGKEHGYLHAKDDGSVDELLPALAQVAKGLDGHDTGRQVHHEQFHAVAAENEQRQQVHNVHRQDEPLAEECQQIQRKHRERHHIEGRRGNAFQEEGNHGGQQEHGEKIEVAVLVFEDVPVGEEDAEVQDHHQRQGQQDVAGIQQHAGGAVTKYLVVLFLVAVEDLGHFSCNDFSFGDYLFIGPYVSQRGGNVVRGPGVGELRH